MRIVGFLPLLLIAACNPPSGTPADNALVANEVAPGVENSAVTPPSNSSGQPRHEAPEPAPIPAKFRGTWAENNAACADLSHHSRLTISGRTVRHPDFVIFGDSFTFPTADQFALKGKVEATGAPIEAHYSINGAGDVLTDEAGGGAVRVRCT